MLILFKPTCLPILKIKNQDLLIWIKALGMSGELGDSKLLLLFSCKYKCSLQTVLLKSDLKLARTTFLLQFIFRRIVKNFSYVYFV